MEVGAFQLLCQGLDIGDLLLRRGLIGVDEVVEELVDVLHIRRHAVLEDIVGIGVIA